MVHITEKYFEIKAKAQEGRIKHFHAISTANSCNYNIAHSYEVEFTNLILGNFHELPELVTCIAEQHLYTRPLNNNFYFPSQNIFSRD